MYKTIGEIKLDREREDKRISRNSINAVNILATNQKPTYTGLWGGIADSVQLSRTVYDSPTAQMGNSNSTIVGQ